MARMKLYRQLIVASIGAVLTSTITDGLAQENRRSLIAEHLVYLNATAGPASEVVSQSGIGFFISDQGHILTTPHLLAELGPILDGSLRIGIRRGSPSAAETGIAFRRLDVRDQGLLLLQVDTPLAGPPVCVDDGPVTPTLAPRVYSVVATQFTLLGVGGTIVGVDPQSGLLIVDFKAQPGAPVYYVDDDDDTRAVVIGLFEGEYDDPQAPGFGAVIPIARAAAMAELTRCSVAVETRAELCCGANGATTVVNTGPVGGLLPTEEAVCPNNNAVVAIARSTDFVPPPAALFDGSAEFVTELILTCADGSVVSTGGTSSEYLPSALASCGDGVVVGLQGFKSDWQRPVGERDFIAEFRVLCDEGPNTGTRIGMPENSRWPEYSGTFAARCPPGGFVTGVQGFRADGRHFSQLSVRCWSAY